MTSHTNAYKDMFFKTREEAEKVLETMRDIATTYGHATMADLMDTTDNQTVFADTKFRWTKPMLEHAEIHRIRYGYTLTLIDPIYELDKPKVSYRRYYYGKPADNKPHMAPFKPQPVYITINRDVHEDVDDILKSLFQRMVCLPGREFHITIE